MLIDIITTSLELIYVYYTCEEEKELYLLTGRWHCIIYMGFKYIGKHWLQ